MALETLRGYLSLAGGLTAVTRAKAVAQAKALLEDDTLAPLVEGGQRAQAQVQALAEEILAAGRANRELLKGVVRAEVERAVGSVGIAGQDDVDALRASLDRMERRLAVLESKDAAATASSRTTSSASGATKSASKTASKKPVAKKTPAPRNATGGSGPVAPEDGAHA
jgi:polyhydroxyalkanoate synthesis regulator phasin